MRCPLGEKSRADRAAKAAIKKAKTGKEQVIDEYEYSVLIVSTEHLAQVEELQSSPLLEQVHFYDSRATIESASI